MNYRLNSTTIAIVALLAVIAAGLFAYTLISAPAEEEVVPDVAEEQSEEQVEQIISAKHQYADGVHTIAGVVRVPTSCHGVVIEPFFVDGAATTTVELRFTTVLEGEECPAIESDAPFKVTFDAPEDARIEVVWDGAPVRLNLVPVGPGESLDEEFYFKG